MIQEFIFCWLNTEINRFFSFFISEKYLDGRSHSVLTFTVNTKPIVATPENNRVAYLMPVFYLKSALKPVQALQSLPSSPLYKHILEPNCENSYLTVTPTINLNRYDLFTGVRIRVIYKF